MAYIDRISQNGTVYDIQDSNAQGSIASAFSASTAYAAGDYVWYSGTLYRFTADHAAGAWTGADAEEAEIGADVADLKSAFATTGLVKETSVSFPETNTYYGTNGKKSSNSASIGTGFVSVNPGDTIEFKLAEHTSFATIAFYTGADQNTFINGSAVIGESSTLSYVESSVSVPETAKYMRAGSWDDTASCYLKIQSVTDISAITSDVEQIKGDIESLGDEIESVSENVSEKMGTLVTYSGPFPNQGYINTSGVIAGTGYDTYCTDFIPVDHMDSSIEYYLSNPGPNALMIAFYSEENPASPSSAFISGVSGTGAVTSMNKGTAAIPNGAKSFRAAQWTVQGVSDFYVRKRYTLGKIVESVEANHDQTVNNNASTTTLQLMESINKPFDFTGKKITAFGDSITQGVTSPGLAAGTPYIRYFADHVGASLQNMAISGTKIADDGQYSIYNRITVTFSGETDFIVIAGGTNDFNSGIELGTFASTAGTDTFYGALKGICEYLASNYSSVPVIFITPIPYTNKDENAPNAAGYTLNQYRKAIYEIGTLYGHSVVNGADLGMPTKAGGWGNAMCDDTDGCHPSAEGHKLMARSLAGKLL